MPDPAPLPLQRDTFPAHRLMTEHPPVLRDPNKQVVFGVACPAGTMREGVYNYASATGVEGAEEWHVNFADPRLFTAYGLGLFAQNEVRVAEHPELGALREALHARSKPGIRSAPAAPWAMPPSIGVRACDRYAPRAR